MRKNMGDRETFYNAPRNRFRAYTHVKHMNRFYLFRCISQWEPCRPSLVSGCYAHVFAESNVFQPFILFHSGDEQKGQPGGGVHDAGKFV